MVVSEDVSVMDAEWVNEFALETEFVAETEAVVVHCWSWSSNDVDATVWAGLRMIFWEFYGYFTRWNFCLFFFFYVQLNRFILKVYVHCVEKSLKEGQK